MGEEGADHATFGRCMKNVGYQLLEDRVLETSLSETDMGTWVTLPADEITALSTGGRVSSGP